VVSNDSKTLNLLQEKAQQTIQHKLKPHIEKLNELMRFEFKKMMYDDPQILEAVSKIFTFDKDIKGEMSKMIAQDPKMVELMNEKGLIALPLLSPSLSLIPSLLIVNEPSSHYPLEVAGEVKGE
jgi:hypothetical protein